jgi:hypothetical protein
LSSDFFFFVVQGFSQSIDHIKFHLLIDRFKEQYNLLGGNDLTVVNCNIS